MLVKLYALPELSPVLAKLQRCGVRVRPAKPPEKFKIVEWVRSRFEPWASEVDVAFARKPVSCFIAVSDKNILGFSCYDVACPNFFGPIGVDELQRGRGIGAALLLAALHAQRCQGYAYAIIGGVGPAEFYAKTVGATLIEGSHPGFYQGMLDI
jgi:predicted N-acetyltransferase YhbS